MKSKIKHGWNVETQKTICGVSVNNLTMQKALWVASDKKHITCRNCKKIIKINK